MALLVTHLSLCIAVSVTKEPLWLPIYHLHRSFGHQEAFLVTHFISYTQIRSPRSPLVPHLTLASQFRSPRSLSGSPFNTCLADWVTKEPLLVTHLYACTADWVTKEPLWFPIYTLTRADSVTKELLWFPFYACPAV